MTMAVYLIIPPTCCHNSYYTCLHTLTSVSHNMFACTDAITVALISSFPYIIINAIVVVAIVAVFVKFLPAVWPIH